MDTNRTEPDENWTPRRALRRASNLLTSYGKPNPALEGVLDMGQPQEPLTPKSKRRFSDQTIGSAFGSLKRRISGARRESAAPDRFKFKPGSVPPYPYQKPTFTVPPEEEKTVDEEEGVRPDDIKVPIILQLGIPMLKVNAKGTVQRMFRLDPDQGLILWESKKSGIIVIENIKELRACSDARYYREQFKLPESMEERWLTITYLADGKYKTLHLVALTKDGFNLWHETLQRLYSIRVELMSGLGNFERRQTLMERHYWKGADFTGDSQLDFKEIERMSRRMSLSLNQRDLKALFDAADSRKMGLLTFEDFQTFMKSLKARKDIYMRYNKVKGQGEFTLELFEKFQRETQKEKRSKAELEAIFKKYATPIEFNKPLPSIPSFTRSPSGSATNLQPSPAGSTTKLANTIRSKFSKLAHHYSSSSRGSSPSAPATPTLLVPEPKPSKSLLPALRNHPQPLVLTLDGFTTFLMSADNSPFSDTQNDMTRPLSEYYISSSHNTYLVGHQLVGVSTIEGYIRALLHSCRSVEIDIYDGEEEPVITHGGTLTSKISLRVICDAIAKYAFVASPYPIIISAEVHCGLPQQDMIASIMKSSFGEMLVDSPISDEKEILALPSPEQLKHRILLKAKNLFVGEATLPTDYVVGEAAVIESSGDSSSSSDTESAPFTKAKNLVDRVRRRGGSRASYTLPAPISIPSTSSNIPAMDSPTPGDYSLGMLSSSPIPGPMTPRVRMSMHLVALLVYTVGVKCRGLNKKERYAVEHVFSLSEKVVNKMLKGGSTGGAGIAGSIHDLVKHTRTHIVRIYPKGTRLSSTNYEPHRYWAAGAQLVAINWQTFDIGYMINHAMFQRNFKAGYVLKPAALRYKDKELLAKRTTYNLKLRIISAQQLPRPRDENGREIVNKSIVDPYVQVSVHVPDWINNPYPNTSSSAGAPLSNSPILRPSSLRRSSEQQQSLAFSNASASLSSQNSPARVISSKTGIVKNNGFNPIWEEDMSLHFDVVGDMLDLVFVRFSVKDEDVVDDEKALAVYCASLGSLRQGYRHLPLHDRQMSQYLFSTLFVQIDLQEVHASRI